MSLTRPLMAWRPKSSLPSTRGTGSLLQQTVARYANEIPAELWSSWCRQRTRPQHTLSCAKWPGIDLVVRSGGLRRGFDCSWHLGRVFLALT